MVNLAILATRATDWTGQDWTQRLRACAETLYIHDCIDFHAYNAALDQIDAAQRELKSITWDGHRPKAGVKASCIIPNCRKGAPAHEPFCSDHRDPPRKAAQPDYAAIGLGGADLCEGRN